MHLVWLTDIHLNFLGQPFGPKAFGEIVRKEHPTLDAVVVTGDIAECWTFKEMIENFAEGVNAPVWFILGNHDAYNGSIHEMKEQAATMTGRARWLVTEKLVELAPGVALVGVDGWYDARNGFPEHSNVVMSDFIAIREYLGKWDPAIISFSRGQGEKEALLALDMLQAAVAAGYNKIVFATHVPPYAQSAWHEGSMSNGHWLPWMSSQVMGQIIDEVSGEHPDVEFTVLCGHTHSEGVYQRSPNVTVRTGHSEYYKPRVCGEFKF